MSLYSFNHSIVFLILYHYYYYFFKRTSWLADVTLKQWIYVHLFFPWTYIRAPLGKGGSTGAKGCAEQWMGKKKEDQMEVRWLLTNRKHGGKTKSVSVLKAALKNGGVVVVGGGEQKS